MITVVPNLVSAERICPLALSRVQNCSMPIRGPLSTATLFSHTGTPGVGLVSMGLVRAGGDDTTAVHPAPIEVDRDARRGSTADVGFEEILLAMHTRQVSSASEVVKK